MTDQEIATFLLARIAEDEAVARAALIVHRRQVEHLGGGKWGRDYMKPMPAEDVRRQVVASIPSGMSSPGDSWGDVPGTRHFERFSPARVLAECEAKRLIVKEVSEDDALYKHATYAIRPHDPDCWTRGALWGLEYALRELAAVYADHPDYRDEWRP